MTWGLAVAELFEALCEDHLTQPVFVKDHPLEISPLTKKKRGDERLVERFEPYAAKMEIGNAYSELTDPVDQLDRFLAQRRRGDEPKPLQQEMHKPGDKDEYEDHPIDADFVKAIGCGMPPTGGVGLGIDRLVMLLTDTPGIRDIIGFPMVKPKSKD
jgi:lysyl-tRNA synthetase class 2